MLTKGGHNNKNVKAFTLVEMLIVLLIMGILLMMTMGFSGYQIQKLENKSVKESILAEWQSRYSRNLGSSSYEGNIYDSMTISLESGSNQIDFSYKLRGQENGNFTGSFSNKFIIKDILTNSGGEPSGIIHTGNVNIKYTPYRMYCDWGGESKELAIIMTIDNAEDYCFEINKNNCRLVEVNCNPSWYTIN